MNGIPGSAENFVVYMAKPHEAKPSHTSKRHKRPKAKRTSKKHRRTRLSKG